MYIKQICSLRTKIMVKIRYIKLKFVVKSNNRSKVVFKKDHDQSCTCHHPFYDYHTDSSTDHKYIREKIIFLINDIFKRDTTNMINELVGDIDFNNNINYIEYVNNISTYDHVKTIITTIDREYTIICDDDILSKYGFILDKENYLLI